MRIFSALMLKRNVRQDNVPFQDILPLKLKKRVSGKATKGSEVCCLHEMSILFACFKANDFNQSMCSKEIESFQKCYTKFSSDRDKQRARDAQKFLTPGEKNLTSKQLNILLKRYPDA
ncbi:coiled-coil-helix-coiled-coil-helix domain-containing protein 1 [Sitophilus oryzae]|uniref:Coiled-coil-helix-coiled-coil-helix domain-containing protein 1 n=1 Tax=Sitophilus oryzae TaxID=7048 RepID=A0A6J2Y6X9_SITOR|nr:coiled-coil-helix-coiled-coil-helix domain-containing protein 1 [Sitophilus oryzae]